jgi:CO/xanthine dehydrogenase FAD-binding subunit
VRSDVEYLRPLSLDEAVDFLSDHGPETKPLAGGTDLLIDMRSGKLKARYIMDVARIPELSGITVTEEGLSIGAGATITKSRFRKRSSALLRCFARPASPSEAPRFATRRQ